MRERPKGQRRYSSGAVAIRPMRRVENLRYGLLDSLMGYALRRAQNAVYVDFAQAVGDADLTPQRFAALVLVVENEPLSQSVFADAMGLDRSVATRLLAWLNTRGWIERSAHGEDSRQRLLSPTAEGRKQCAAASTLVAAHDRRIFAELGPEVDIVRNALDKLSAAGRTHHE